MSLHDKIYCLYERNPHATFSSIAKEVGCHHSTVSLCLQKRGVPKRYGHRPEPREGNVLALDSQDTVAEMILTDLEEAAYGMVQFARSFKEIPLSDEEVIRLFNRFHLLAGKLEAALAEQHADRNRRKVLMMPAV